MKKKTIPKLRTRNIIIDIKKYRISSKKYKISLIVSRFLTTKKSDMKTV